LADRPPLGRAMDSVERVLAVLEDVKRASAERIVEAGRHAAGPFVLARDLDRPVFRELGLPGDHLLGREPARPGLLPLDQPAAAPFEALPTQTDAIAHRLAIIADEV